MRVLAPCLGPGRTRLPADNELLPGRQSRCTRPAVAPRLPLPYPSPKEPTLLFPPLCSSPEASPV